MIEKANILLSTYVEVTSLRPSSGLVDELIDQFMFFVVVVSVLCF
jgi:hypothetical protein